MKNNWLKIRFIKLIRVNPDPYDYDANARRSWPNESLFLTSHVEYFNDIVYCPDGSHLSTVVYKAYFTDGSIPKWEWSLIDSWYDFCDEHENKIKNEVMVK